VNCVLTYQPSDMLMIQNMSLNTVVKKLPEIAIFHKLNRSCQDPEFITKHLVKKMSHGYALCVCASMRTPNLVLYKKINSKAGYHDSESNQNNCHHHLHICTKIITTDL
jgi:hypothetical protein